MTRFSCHRARGFTLIEVMIAVVILGILAGATALAFTGPLHRARTVEAIEQLRYLDASARDLARRTGRSVTLAFDLSENILERRDRPGGPAVFRANIPSPLRIDAVWRGRQRITDGQAQIAVSPLALSETYAVKLAAPQGERWLLVSGLSGQTKVLNDDAQVESILEATTPRRDAD
ncbi:MAG TPA: type II secretion system protein [Tepidisphaeraceae bacterium]|jgi:prepilin-type N-terminal cleavage/methylation domain-containing protein